MRVVIAGGRGNVALHLGRLLATRGDSVTALVGDREHFAGVEEVGAVPVHWDPESADAATVAEHLSGADAAVFAAGTWPEEIAAPELDFVHTDAVEGCAAVLFAQAAEQAGVRRLLNLSSMLVDFADDPIREPGFAAFLRAKAAAEEDLRKRDLDWTIVRPGALTDDPPAGLVSLAESVPYGPVPRGDVAAVLVALLDEPRSVRRTLEVTSGDTPVKQAVTEAVV